MYVKTYTDEFLPTWIDDLEDGHFENTKPFQLFWKTIKKQLLSIKSNGKQYSRLVLGVILHIVSKL